MNDFLKVLRAVCREIDTSSVDMSLVASHSFCISAWKFFAQRVAFYPLRKEIWPDLFINLGDGNPLCLQEGCYFCDVLGRFWGPNPVEFHFFSPFPVDY